MRVHPAGRRGNAVAASRVRKTPVLVDLERLDDVLRLTVRDEGIGIASEHLERIFEPGFTTREFGSGSGTGLTVVRQVTRQRVAGEVRVDSAVGQGSAFTVEIPIPAQRSASSASR